ncbi:MAG: hypothetical protein HY273_13005 [Gammaproteobacteria bacterium]|nr:hypothetical protein [Gammaproteobacteria bacterium]
MNAGLPGTGIGGVFYLLCALLMPFYEVVKTLRGESNWRRWVLIFKQLVMAAGIIGGMWALGLVLGLLLEARPDHEWVQMAQDFHANVTGQLEHASKFNVFHVAPVIMSIITLSIIITTTNILRIFYRPVAVSDAQ